MSRNHRFPKATLGDLGSALADLKRTLIKSEAAAAEVRRQQEAEDKRCAALQPARPVQQPTGPKPKLTAAALARLSTPLPGETKEGAAEGSRPTAPQTPHKPVKPEKPVARSASSQKPKPAMVDDPAKLRKSAADRVRALVGGSTPSVEERPHSISVSSKAIIDRAVTAGSAILRDRPEPDEDGYIIGFDFGTSSLKVAYRQPYVADDPVAVIPVPDELQSAKHPGLWQSVIWYHPGNEEFLLYPVDGAIALDGFKTGLIAGHGSSPMPQVHQVTRAEAATGFLALQFAYMVGAYTLEQPLHPVGADHFVLINIGIPVAVRDDKRAFSEFSRMVAAAYVLASKDGPLKLQALKAELAEAPTTLPPYLQLVPELTAAIAGYAADPMAQHGAHILIDVGASTLDIVAFNLQAQLKASVFTAGVDLFGAGALEVARSAGIDDSTFIRACDYLFEDVYGKAKADTRAPSLFKPGRRRVPVQLVITGGGCDSDVHARYINLLPQDEVLGAVPLKRPAPPPKILRKPSDQSRLLLAYGLTRDVTELYELRLPSEIEDLPIEEVAVFRFIDKDMI